MTPNEIVDRMVSSGYVDAGMVSHHPEQTLETLVNQGLHVVGSEVVDGYTIFFLDPEVANG